MVPFAQNHRGKISVPISGRNDLCFIPWIPWPNAHPGLCSARCFGTFIKPKPLKIHRWIDVHCHFPSLSLSFFGNFWIQSHFGRWETQQELPKFFEKMNALEEHVPDVGEDYAGGVPDVSGQGLKFKGGMPKHTISIHFISFHAISYRFIDSYHFL